MDQRQPKQEKKIQTHDDVLPSCILKTNRWTKSEEAHSSNETENKNATITMLTHH